MNFWETHDLGVVKRILSHPRIYPHITDDFSPPVESFEPGIHPNIHYVLAVSDEDNILGCFVFEEHSPVVWEVHTCLLPEAWGSSERICRMVAEWVFSRTEVNRIVTQVPAHNRLAYRLAKRAGMTEYGRNPASFKKHGVLEDVILLGLTRKETD